MQDASGGGWPAGDTLGERGPRLSFSGRRPEHPPFGGSAVRVLGPVPSTLHVCSSAWGQQITVGFGLVPVPGKPVLASSLSILPRTPLPIGATCHDLYTNMICLIVAVWAWNNVN